MAHHKRRKPRRHVKCCLCTKDRYGNGKESTRPNLRRNNDWRND